MEMRGDLPLFLYFLLILFLSLLLGTSFILAIPKTGQISRNQSKKSSINASEPWKKLKPTLVILRIQRAQSRLLMLPVDYRNHK